MYLLRKVGKQLKGIFVKQPDNVVLPENTDSSDIDINQGLKGVEWISYS